jgi:hypothetical protein
MLSIVDFLEFVETVEGWIQSLSLLTLSSVEEVNWNCTDTGTGPRCYGTCTHTHAYKCMHFCAQESSCLCFFEFAHSLHVIVISMSFIYTCLCNSSYVLWELVRRKITMCMFRCLSSPVHL